MRCQELNCLRRYGLVLADGAPGVGGRPEQRESHRRGRNGQNLPHRALHSLGSHSVGANATESDGDAVGTL